MLLSALPFLVVAQSSSEVPEGLMSNSVLGQAMFLLLFKYFLSLYRLYLLHAADSRNNLF